MAKRYPHAKVTGVDLAPNVLDQTIIPSNLHFEVDDVNNGLRRFHDKFDVVHARCILGGIYNPDRTMEDMQLCLKPGGLVIFIEGDIDMYDEDRLHRVKIPDPIKEGPDSEGSWFRKIVWGGFASQARNQTSAYIHFDRGTSGK